ncbi:5717_t:CDS:2 [Gigaspora margarita]|uniref:5717_t:CDS:1 n=1 Tax=Gigaspora margarita TaxID=4874 RepID=A0ABN7V2Z7_GIGMA|nr:5717_t:CDS:2 [Gigaspora margarita]
MVIPWKTFSCLGVQNCPLFAPIYPFMLLVIEVVNAINREHQVDQAKQSSVQSNNLQESSYSQKNKRNKSPAPDTKKDHCNNCNEVRHIKKHCSRNLQQAKQIICYNYCPRNHSPQQIKQVQQVQPTQQLHQTLIIEHNKKPSLKETVQKFFN